MGRGYYAQLLLSGRWRALYAECRAGERPPHRFLALIVMRMLNPDLEACLRRPLWGPRSFRVFERWHWFICPAFAQRVAPLPEPGIRDVSVRRTQLQLLQHGGLGMRIESWAASGARHGIEYRYPLLDRRMLEFALGLPPDQFRRGRWTRWLMRHALSSPGSEGAAGAPLPAEICWNPSKVFYTKSPPHLVIVDELAWHFRNAKFLFMVRNPYAVCEGIIRDYENHRRHKFAALAAHFPERTLPELAAAHVVACLARQRRNVEAHGDRGTFLTYEEMCAEPERVAHRIWTLVPALDDLRLRQRLRAKGRYEMLTDMNARQIARLDAAQLAACTRVFREHRDVLDDFGYELL